MIYNDKMKETPLVIETGLPGQKLWKPVWVTWSIAIVSILVACLALVIGIQRAWLSGSYSTLITHQTLNPFITIGFAVIGSLVANRQPRNPIGWIFMAVGCLFALTSLAAAVTTSEPQHTFIYSIGSWFNSWIWLPAVLLPWAFVLPIFPDGQLPSPRWRFIIYINIVGLAITSIAMMYIPDSLLDGSSGTNPFGSSRTLYLMNFGAVLLGAGFLGSLVAFFLRFRSSTGNQRLQMKWLFYAIAINLLTNILCNVIWFLWPDLLWMEEISIVITNIGILGIAIAAAIAILRYHLYDINLIINRTLVYTALTASVAALYILVFGALGVTFQARDNLFVSLLATILAAILVQPMRDKLQRLVNRLMYGDRDEPYAVLSGLSRRLEGSLLPEDTLPAVVETVAQTLKLPYVAIALKQEGTLKISASYGVAGEDIEQLPLIYQGEMVGQLRLSPRAPNELFTPGEQRLLRDIARHVGVTAHTVRLTRDLRQLAEDLQRSREELVKGREEERRRLRRDLHDELGPQLASLKLNLDVARNLVLRDPNAAEALLVDLRTQSQSAIADIRRLVYDLRPPALDELGLAGAIQEYTRQISSQGNLHLRFQCPNNLPPLPAAAEVATYRITLEALANIIRHSQAQYCSVSISSDSRHLLVEICDDGQGIPVDVHPGVGIISMRERAEELGGKFTIEALPHGGTRVLAQLPLV